MARNEQHKQIVREFLAALAAHQADRLESMLCDDATYWSCGKPHLFAYAGEKSKAEFCKMMRSPSRFIGGLVLTPGAVTAEGDRVSVEAESDGLLPDGRRYTNSYHFLFTFRDGRIAKVREYMDTQSAAEFFTAPDRAAGR